MEQLTLWSAGLPASPSLSQEKEKDLMGLLASSENISGFYRKCIRASSFGKMCRAVSVLGTRKEATLSSFSGNGLTSGIMSHGEYWTLSISEWPKDAAVCSLSEVLETGEIPSKYFLSPKACQGILRRAEKRGKKIPEALRVALERQAIGAADPTPL
jgi:hypothetical protein